MTAMRLHRYPSPSGGTALGKIGCTDLFHRITITARDYVQDGLVAMWDGIENAGWGVHDTSATNWVDLSGNYNDMEVYSAAHFESDCLVTPTMRPSGKIYADTRKPMDFLTAEYVAEIFGFGGIVSFSGMANDRFFNYQASYFQFHDPNTLVPQSGSMPSKACCQCVYNSSGVVSAYANGVPLVAGVDSNHWSRNDLSTTFGVGGSGAPNAYSSYQFTGRVFAIRLYSRALIADEIARNYAIDKARFHLPDIS